MTEQIKISKLKLLEKNPRRISKDAMQLLKNSLEHDPDFLKLRPVLVNLINGIYTVYAGNQRVRAAKELGWTEISCIVEKDLDEKLIKERVIKDNKTFGEFDFDLLANEWDVELLLDCGFSQQELIGNEISLIDTESEGSNDNKQKAEKLCPNCGHNLN